MKQQGTRDNSHVCPWWFIWTFDNPVRKWIHNPAEIFAGLAAEGDTVLDVGCGAGFFTVGLARLVGDSGRVIAADLQPEMLAQVGRRAKRLGLDVTLHLCAADEIGLEEQVDAINAFWMAHEVPDQRAFLAELHNLLRPGRPLLVAEPRLHVEGKAFEHLLSIAEEIGFLVEPRQGVSFSRAAVLWKAAHQT